MPSKKLKCVRCRASFWSIRPARFCGRECRDKNAQAVRLKERAADHPPCADCGKPLTTGKLKGRIYCNRYCNNEARKKREHQKTRERESIPRSCALKGCDKKFAGRAFIRYCSYRCLKQSYYSGPSYSAERHRERHLEYVARKTAENLENAPPCTICGKTTARSGGNSYTHRTYARTKTPPNIHLCIGHTKGYAVFISRNGYQDVASVDDLFTAYLVILSFSPSNGQEMRHMMREAFHSSRLNPEVRASQLTSS